MPESTSFAGESQQTSDRESGHEALDGESQKAVNPLEEVRKLLQGDDDQDKADQVDKKPDGKQGESQDKSKPKSLDDLAKRLGVEVKDLYDIEFPLGTGDGERRTLGQLKDLVSEQDNFTVAQLQFEETKTKKEAEFLRANAELKELITMLPKAAIKPELLQTIARKHAQILEREKGLTLSAIPEWSDEVKEQADKTQMREHLQAYGYTSNYLDSITDHRTLKYIRDNMQRQQRIERVLAQVKQVNKPGHKSSIKPSGQTGKPPPGRRVNPVASQVAKVSELLKGTG